jgi:two-component system NarL family sensor kinase
MPKNRMLIVLLLMLCNSFIFAFSEEKTPTKKEIESLTIEANNLLEEGLYEKSLIKSRLALQYAYMIMDNELIAKCYKTIAANVDELNEADKAFYYYTKSLFYANKSTNIALKNSLNNNLGNIYCFDKKELKKGISYYNKSIAYSKQTNDFKQIILTYINITWAYFEFRYFEKGLPYLKYLNKNYGKYRNDRTIVIYNTLNAMYYEHINDYAKAKTYYENAEKLANIKKTYIDLSVLHKEYSRFLMKIGDYKKAYESLAVYSKINDDLYNEEKQNTTVVAGINLELDESKRKIKEIETAYNKKQELFRAEQSKNQKILFIIICLFAFSGILYYFLNQNIKLKQKNRLNKIQSKTQQKIINATIYGQELERKKIASFLHDNISSQLSSAGLHLFAFSAITKIESEEIVKTKQILNQVHDEIRNLSHQLSPVILSKFGVFYALKEVCEKNSNTILKIEFTSSISIRKRYAEDFEIKVYYIINELINNSLKHSGGTHIKLTINEVNDEILFNIKDNGKGFDTTNYIVQKGFGLNQVRARVTNMNGKFSVISNLNNGTNVYIKLPIQIKTKTVSLFQ